MCVNEKVGRREELLPPPRLTRVYRKLRANRVSWCVCVGAVSSARVSAGGVKQILIYAAAVCCGLSERGAVYATITITFVYRMKVIICIPSVFLRTNVK